MAPSAKRAALIGFDCLIPKRLQRLLKEGGLDNFRRFIKEGSYMTEGFNLPTVTPPSWATICTGAYPRTHGVEDYYYYHDGKPLDHKYTTQAFGSDILTAETIWDAWDKAGKKSIVVNYPMSWPSHMKNGVVVMGCGLSPSETRWPLYGNEHKEHLASESVISTELYPFGARGKFDDAEEFRLYVSGIAGRTGFTAPASAEKDIDFSGQITANDIGFVSHMLGIIDNDTIFELAEFHAEWLWNTTKCLIEANPDWNLFYMHSHPIDWFYHGFLAQLDSEDEAVRKEAERVERRIYESEDRLLGRLMDLFGEETEICVCSDHGATPLGPIFNPAHALSLAGLCSYELKPATGNFWEVYEETEGLNYILDSSKSQAVPQRYMFVYVNLKDKYPGGIVDPADYEKVRTKIIDALLDYRHPDTGERPVLVAVRKEDAHVFGMGGAQAGDVVYALRPEYMAEHGYGFPTGESGRDCTLLNLLMFRGPNVKKGYVYDRPRWLADIVPTLCYLTGNPVPADTEGAPIYQIMEDPNLVK